MLRMVVLTKIVMKDGLVQFTGLKEENLNQDLEQIRFGLIQLDIKN